MSNNNEDSQITSTIGYNYSKNQLHGDIIGGHKVNDDSSISKNISMAKGIMNESPTSSQEQFERLYRSVFLAIEKRPEDQKVKKGELRFIAENIYKELLHESTANLPEISLWLKQLNSLAPDVFQTSIAVLTSPTNGLSNETREEIEKVSNDCEPVSEMNMPINVYLENELTVNNVSPGESERMRGELVELQQAVQEGNVRPIRQLLVDLTQLPGMKQPLRHWLVESAGIPTAIKVFARNYLDRL